MGVEGQCTQDERTSSVPPERHEQDSVVQSLRREPPHRNVQPRTPSPTIITSVNATLSAPRCKELAAAETAFFGSETRDPSLPEQSRGSTTTSETTDRVRGAVARCGPPG